ncbi:MAG: prepilin-type N-terminal cleavage/methylation domain-containing protein [Candidatus Riflebacteria bacterium]|nr:prepilin-type N-terminal cleavage/methylation domain-containing protein [Candidatus Riflebacteria bacterium]
MQNPETRTKSIKTGFSLIEILISLLVISGALTTMFAGFDTSSKLAMHAEFETEAAFIAERELEIVKAELLCGKILPRPAGMRNRFRLKPGWKATIIMAAADKTGTIRILSSVRKGDRLFQLESFLFLPEPGGKG